MTNPLPVRMREVAVWTAVIYAAAGVVWIAGSDHLVSLVTSDAKGFERLSTYKGWAFVAVTALLLYLALRRILVRWEHEAAERQRAATALQQSEARFRIFVEHAGDAFFLHDDQGKIIDANQHGLRQLGYSRDELLRLHVWDVDVDIVKADALTEWKAARAGETTTLARRHRRKDGSVVEVELRLACFESAERRMFLALARDITDRRTVEAVDEGNRRVLEMIALGADLPETLEELARTIEDKAPGALCSILLADAGGKRLRHAVGPSLPAEYNAMLADVEVGPVAGSCGTAIYRRERVVVADIQSDPLWVNYRDVARIHGLAACWSTPFFGVNHEVLGTLAIYYRTPRLPTPGEVRIVERVTHTAAIAVTRHRVEQALRENTARLREAQDRLTSALEVGGIGTFVVDFEKNETIWDESLARMYGRAWRPEDGAAPEPFLRLVHPDDRGRVRAEMNRTLNGNEPSQSEYRIVHPDGAVRWVATTARVERSEAGRPVRFIGATVDITSRKLAEENFRQAQKVEAIGQLSGGIAHDFNNILTVIQAGVSFLELEPDLSPPVREFVAEIKAAASRAANLTRQLLTFSRRQAMQLRYIELNEVVTNMSRMLQRVLGEHIHMELRLAPHDVGIFGDAGMIEQVVMNLAVNARDAMPGGGQLLICTRVETLEDASTPGGGPARQGRFVCLEVSDTGAGIPSDALPHIFEPFFTTKEAGRGTGLGLATVSGIVEQHGGWVDVETEVSRGTRFAIHLPLISAREMERANRLATFSGRGGSETILLVEDEAVVRALVRNLLRRSGYRVIEAPSGPRAIELWNESGREIDLLITDLVMPEGMNGHQLADRLRKDRPGLRVLFTSGYSPEMVGRGDAPNDGTAFLAKPFDLEHLTTTVRALLDQRPASEGAGTDMAVRHCP